MSTEIKKIVNETLLEVFPSLNGEINKNWGPDQIQDWDSLAHLNLVMAIEAEFDVELTPEDSMDMLSVKLIRMIVSDALNN